MTSIITPLRDAMHAAGLDPGSDPIQDGLTHRFHVSGDKRSSRNGWYRYHLDFPVNATFGTYKRQGEVHQWRPNGSKPINQRTPLTDFNTKPQPRPYDHYKVWREAPPARNSHPYLVRKGVPSFGLRYHRGALLLCVDDVEGSLMGLQQIWPDGTKRFTPGTAKIGHFFMIGTATARTDTIIICEGYATGATIHEATRHPVAVAFDAGNLKPVAEVLHAAFPLSRIVLCADDDHSTEGNPGVTLAIAAARAVSGLVSVPFFSGSRGENDTDFNDLARKEGVEMVRLQLAAAEELPCSE